MKEYSSDADLTISLPFVKKRILDDIIIRIADFILALSCLIIIGPFVPFIIIIIKLDSPGPIIFKQRRPGKNGIPFTIYKFRTMCDGADKLSQEFRNENEPVMKMANDSRITKVGMFLRKYSIDEFPQFLNILKGDMSFVGPRPTPFEEYNVYNEYQKRRVACKPGLTGLAQVNGRSDLNFDSIVKYDIEFIKKRSFLLYFKILLKTIPYFLLAKSSY